MIVPVTTYHDLINEVVRLYFGFCAAATAAYQMGPYSGAKRSILLFLRTHESATLQELVQEFKDPAHTIYGQAILQEMMQQGWLMAFPMAMMTRVRLTPAGVAQAQAIFDHEKRLVELLPQGITGSDLMQVVQTLQRLTPITKALTDQSPSDHKVSDDKARAA